MKNTECQIVMVEEINSIVNVSLLINKIKRFLHPQFDQVSVPCTFNASSDIDLIGCHTVKNTNYSVKQTDSYEVNCCCICSLLLLWLEAF